MPAQLLAATARGAAGRQGPPGARGVQGFQPHAALPWGQGHPRRGLHPAWQGHHAAGLRRFVPGGELILTCASPVTV